MLPNNFWCNTCAITPIANTKRFQSKDPKILIMAELGIRTLGKQLTFTRFPAIRMKHSSDDHYKSKHGAPPHHNQYGHGHCKKKSYSSS